MRNKFTNRIFVIFSGYLIFSIGIVLVLYYLSEPQVVGCATQLPNNFCGTVASNISENAAEGKKLFNKNCAACHKLDKKMTGPALRGISVNRQFPYKNFLFDFITNEDSLIKINDRYTKFLNDEYQSSFDHNFKLNQIEFQYLMEYVN